MEDIDKFSRRLIKVTRTHAEEAKQLLQLMGIPYIDVSVALYVCIIELLSFVYAM